jgi:hypothetical protein
MALIADGGGGYSFYLDPSWPGLDSGDKVEVDRDELKKIIRDLQDDLDDYGVGVNGTLNDLQTRGAKATVAELGQYPAAQGLAQSTQAAQTQIGGKYGEFLASYGSVIQALRKAAGAYDDMEQQNTAAANRVSTGNAPPANSGNTQYYGGGSNPSAV